MEPTSHPGTPFIPCSARDIDDLAGLTDLALPGERLSADELLTLCFEDPDPSAVLALPDFAGAAAVTCRGSAAHLQLLAIAPAQQGAGLGRALLAAAEAWAAEEGRAKTMVVGGGAPFYLWPGIDVRWTRSLAMFESAGYRDGGAALNMSCPTTFRVAPPAGVTISRVIADGDAAAALALGRAHWPHWVAELERAIDHGACFLGRDVADGDAIGFACHSVNRVGWVGPMATAPGRRHAGVGAALLSALCADLRSAGLPDAEISWVGPVGFYAKAAGASVSRVFRFASKRLVDRA